METLLPVLSSLVTAIPSVIVDVALIAVAVARWNRHPRVSMLACTSAVMMLVLDVLARAMFVVLPLKLREWGRSAAELGVVYAAMGGVSGLLHAVALGLLVGAVFADRGPWTGPPARL